MTPANQRPPKDPAEATLRLVLGFVVLYVLANVVFGIVACMVFASSSAREVPVARRNIELVFPGVALARWLFEEAPR